MRVDDTAGNAAQAAYWNEGAGSRWAMLYERIDSVFAPITAALLEQARPRGTEFALDIGCGSGTTSFAFADRIGPQGHVLGVDISQAMVTVALERSRERRVPNVKFVCADAATYVFENAFSLALSRFGLMFFADPIRALTNIRRALLVDGRLTFASWRSLRENEWFAVPLAAAEPHLPPQPESNPEDPGPFAFANPDRIRRILTAAAFSDVEIQARDVNMSFGSREAAVDFVMRIGPLSRRVEAAEVTADRRVAIARAINSAFALHESPDGIVALTGAVWLVNARR